MPSTRTRVCAHLLRTCVLPGPGPRAPSLFPELESGAITDWPYGVFEGRWIIFRIWLVWSEFLGMQSGDPDSSQSSKFRKRVGPWMSPFPDPDLSFPTQEMGIRPTPVGVCRMQSHALMAVKMFWENVSLYLVLFPASMVVDQPGSHVAASPADVLVIRKTQADPGNLEGFSPPAPDSPPPQLTHTPPGSSSHPACSAVCPSRPKNTVPPSAHPRPPPDHSRPPASPYPGLSPLRVLAERKQWQHEGDILEPRSRRAEEPWSTAVQQGSGAEAGEGGVGVDVVWACGDVCPRGCQER